MSKKGRKGNKDNSQQIDHAVEVDMAATNKSVAEVYAAIEKYILSLSTLAFGGAAYLNLDGGKVYYVISCVFFASSIAALLFELCCSLYGHAKQAEALEQGKPGEYPPPSFYNLLVFTSAVLLVIGLIFFVIAMACPTPHLSS